MTTRRYLPEDDNAPGCAFLAWLALTACFLWACVVYAAGCGGASAETRARYTAEVAACDAAIDAIVTRTGTTEEDDLADLRALRSECERHLAEIAAE